MATKKYKPATPTLRHRQVSDFTEITTSKPEKSLLSKQKSNAGRNNQGRITVRHRGGGVRHHYRIVDFKRQKLGIPAVVQSIEYDPNRSAYISLIAYQDGEKSYILTPEKLQVGDKIQSGENSEIKVGNTLPLKDIPVSSFIHNIELISGKGGQLARTAGAYGVLMGKKDDYVTVKLPSGEVRLIHKLCSATIGIVCNSDRRNTVVGKAGASRWKGKRPTVRGSVMNPCDHPHGGGEGRAPVGYAGPRTPWGKYALGLKTRNTRKQSERFIVSRRKK